MVEVTKTRRLLLSSPRLSEVPELYRFLGNERAMQHTRCDNSFADCRRCIAVHEWRRRKDGFAPWTVRELGTQRVVGWGGLYEDPFDPGWGIELGYYFDPTVWGKGYATELCLAALHVADHQLAKDSVSAFAHPENAASNALLEKMGFELQRFLPEMHRNLYRRRRRG